MTGQGVEGVRKVMPWPLDPSQIRSWWIVDDRGTPDAPLYEPVSGPYPHKRAALDAMRDLDRRR